MQLPRTTIAIDMVKDAGLPYIVVLTNPTTGGVTASYAMLGDVHLAEPGALIGFAGPRVIEQTIREKLPEGFQRSEYLLEHGMVDIVVHRHKLRETVARLCRLMLKLPPPNHPPLGNGGNGAGTAANGAAGPADRRTRRPRNRLPPPQTDLHVRARFAAGGARHAPSAQDRPFARPHRAAARPPRPAAGPAAAGDPCRRHQRQGLDDRLPARRARERRLQRACLHLAASRALQRAHPARPQGRRTARRRRDADRGDRGGAARQRRRADHLLRGDDGGRLPSLRRRIRPISACSRSGSAGASTRPTSSSGRSPR